MADRARGDGTAGAKGCGLDNQVFLIMAAVIGALVLGDVVLNSAEASIFLVRKLVVLVEALSFWRH